MIGSGLNFSQSIQLGLTLILFSQISYIMRYTTFKIYHTANFEPMMRIRIILAKKKSSTAILKNDLENIGNYPNFLF